MSNLTKNTKLNAWLDEMIALTNPANVVLIDGTDEQAEALRSRGLRVPASFSKLNQEKLPRAAICTEPPSTTSRV